MIRRVLVAALFGVGCAGAAPATPPAPEQAPSPVAPAQQPASRRAVRETVTVRDPEAERRIARLELRLLEREAQVEDLQARLDETRAEIVRTLARLQTSASRAEAASGMAEAELAVQSLRASGSQGSPEGMQAARWVQLGSAEFDKQNYGGALYLANQTKGLVAAYKARQGGSVTGGTRTGETPFVIPIRLRAASRGNVRQGPGASFPLAFSVEAGVALIGQSYSEDWIRVSDETGRTGWIFRNLVVRR